MPSRQFTHLKPDEKEVMKRFLARRILEGKYTYDVHLYPPKEDLPEWMTEEEKKHWLELTAKRIDAVCERKDDIWILEVTPRINKAAVGGVLTYRDLYIEQFKPGKPVKMAIVTGVHDPAYDSICHKLGIIVWVV